MMKSLVFIPVMSHHIKEAATDISTKSKQINPSSWLFSPCPLEKLDQVPSEPSTVEDDSSIYTRLLMPTGEFATTKMFRNIHPSGSGLKLNPRKPNPVIHKDAHTLSSPQDGSEGKVFSTKPDKLYLIPGPHVIEGEKQLLQVVLWLWLALKKDAVVVWADVYGDELFGAQLLYSILATAMEGLSEFLNDPN